MTRGDGAPGPARRFEDGVEGLGIAAAEALLALAAEPAVMAKQRDTFVLVELGVREIWAVRELMRARRQFDALPRVPSTSWRCTAATLMVEVVDV